MARIRTVKPELFLDEDLAELSIAARLLFIGLFTQADRRGRLEDRPRRLKALLFPYDDIDIDPLLQDLHGGGFIIRYQVDSLSLIQIVSFEKHQRFTGDEAKTESVYPEYVGAEVVEKQGRNREETRKKHGRSQHETGKGRGKEGKGKERSNYYYHYYRA